MNVYLSFLMFPNSCFWPSSYTDKLLDIDNNNCTENTHIQYSLVYKEIVI